MLLRNTLWDLLKLVLFIGRLKSFLPDGSLRHEMWFWENPGKQESEAMSGTHVFVKRF